MTRQVEDSWEHKDEVPNLGFRERKSFQERVMSKHKA